MNSIVLIFVPYGEDRGKVDARLREQFDSPESTDGRAATSSETIEDAEQLPLWRWFGF